MNVSASPPTPPTPVKIDVPWHTLWRIAIWAGILALAVTAVLRVSGVILQLFIAIFLAIALDTVVRRVQRLGIGRGESIAIVLFGVGATIAALFAVFVPPLVEQGTQLAERAPEITRWIAENDQLQSLDEAHDLSGRAIGWVEDQVADLPGLIASTAGAIVSGIFWLVTLLFLTIFLLVGGGTLVAGGVRIFPRLCERMSWEVMRGAYRNIGAYVVGAITIAFIAGASLAVVLTLLGVPFALPLGTWMMLFGLIPLVGATIGSIPSILVAFAFGGAQTGFAVVAWIVVYQQVENALVQPRVQGRMARLPGAIIFLAVLFGSQLLGIVGALFAVPVAGIVAIVMRQYLAIVGREDMEVPSLLDDEARPTASGSPGACGPEEAVEPTGDADSGDAAQRPPAEGDDATGPSSTS